MRNLMALESNLNIDIPESYWNISKYRATLGHKVNHSFKFTKAGYKRAYHPRFGNIIALYASKNITKGEEILVNYNYARGPVPEWYAALYLEEMGRNWYPANQNRRESQSCGH